MCLQIALLQQFLEDEQQLLEEEHGHHRWQRMMSNMNYLRWVDKRGCLLLKMRMSSRSCLKWMGSSRVC